MVKSEKISRFFLKLSADESDVLVHHREEEMAMLK